MDTQIFRVVPDTGSSDLWVPSHNCSFCTGVNRFQLNKSCSANELKKRVDVIYGDGTKASGSAFVDVVTIADLEVSRQFLIEVDTMNDGASTSMSVDGILGLGHHSVHGEHSDEGRSFVAKLFMENPDIPRMFSFFLTGTDGTSRLVFGDPDVERFAKQDFLYGKDYYMESTDMWLTSVYSIGFARTGVERTFETGHVRGGPALVDSGTSLIVFEPAMWDGLMQELSRYFVGCDLSATDGALMMCECPEDLRTIPDLVINIIDEENGEHPLCMAPEEYIVRTASDHKFICAPSLQRGDKKQPVPIILGMTFLRTFYTNFDIERHRIGFARSIHSALPASARCTVHNKEQKELWIWAVSLASASVAFAIYTCFCGDISACCGWPSCEASKPCWGTYRKTTKEECVQFDPVDAQEQDAEQGESKSTAHRETPREELLKASQTAQNAQYTALSDDTCQLPPELSNNVSTEATRGGTREED